jgi:hypothetical protein
MPHDGLLTVEGAQDSSIYQNTNRPILSTLYEPLSQQLISVLGNHGSGELGEGVGPVMAVFCRDFFEVM